MKRKLSECERERGAHVIALFSALVHAWLIGDREEAAEARRQLKAEGVVVRFQQNKGPNDAT